MCGRFTINLTYDELEEYVRETYHIESMPQFTLPRYNVAPGTSIISVLNDGKKYRIGELKWGFTPSFATPDKNFQLINIKAESIFTKPMFKKAALTKRCVILADSFYEWDHDKQPYRILVKDQKVFKMAAIWNTYITSNQEKVHTVGIITTEANTWMKQVHERMPVILDEDQERIWLTPSIQDESMLVNVLLPHPKDDLYKYPVTKQINSPKFDTIDCIKDLNQV